MRISELLGDCVRLRPWIAVLLLAVSSVASVAQESDLASTRTIAGMEAILAQPQPQPLPFPVTPSVKFETQEHRFFDRRNVALFSSLEAARMLDCTSTWRFRSFGLHEQMLSDPLVDNKPAFIAFSTGMALGNVAGAYLLHRLGFHRAERMATAIHLGFVTRTVVHNYRLQPQPAR